jgi:hypothetical protein
MALTLRTAALMLRRESLMRNHTSLTLTGASFDGKHDIIDAEEAATDA